MAMTVDTGTVLTIATARRLHDLGVRWDPNIGDRFVVANREMDDEVFTVSAMTVEVSDLPTGRVIRFNGTTEWALDSIEQNEAVWLPREDQLRSLLGATFRSLSRRTDGGWRIDLRVADRPLTVTHEDAEEAYASALIGLLD